MARAASKNRDDGLDEFGRRLRYWRGKRKCSQLELALDAGVSSKHLSFIETGRSRPSREMVVLLAEVLALPLRERNALLQAAGFASLYTETELGAPEMDSVRKALEFILRRHEPNGAYVVDRYWNVLLKNDAARRVLAFFMGPSEGERAEKLNLLDLLFDPGGVRPFVTNWTEVASAMIRRVHGEIRGMGPEESFQRLLDRLLSFPDVPSEWRVPDLERTPDVILPLEMRKDGVRLSFFTTITTLGTAQDITLQELRIETFFPADEETEGRIEALRG